MLDVWLVGIFLVFVLELWVDLLVIYTVLYVLCIILDVFFDGIEWFTGLGYLSLD